MTQTKRYDWADLMRGIMMFLVVLYHSEVYYGFGHSWSWVFEPFFLSGFFFISGYLFTRDIAKVDFMSKLKQVCRVIIVPYFIFMIVMALPKIVLGHSNAQQILIDIVMLRASWFVIAIAVMQLLYAAILYIRPSVTSIVVTTAFMFLIGYAFVVMYRDCQQWLVETPWLYSDDLPNRLPACLNLALVQSPFFALGILFRYFEASIPKYVLEGKILIMNVLMYIVLYIWIDHSYIGSSMCVVMDQYNNILLIFLIGLIGIWALMCISNRIQNWKLLNYIGKYSILFYFLNGATLIFVSALIKKAEFMDPDNYFNQFLVAVIATAVMFPCVWFINKYLPLLSGSKDSFNKLSKKLGLRIQW